MLQLIKSEGIGRFKKWLMMSYAVIVEPAEQKISLLLVVADDQDQTREIHFTTNVKF